MSEFVRAVALDDIRIRSGGDGRTVEAYAAIFDDIAEVVDQDGHYLERNSPTAFNKTIAERGGRFPVIYHHGMTIAGSPSERGSVPIGVSTEVKADKRGVLTVSRYSKTELADEVLEAIRSGAVTGQSYGGRFLKSDPMRAPRGGHRAALDGSLRTVTRLEVAMREFGPTPFPAFTGAAIMGIRAQQVMSALISDPLKVDAFLREYDQSTTPDGEPETTTDEGDTSEEAVAVTEEPRPHSARSSLRNRIRAARIIREME
jgi:HK97 family phage prohead protease